MYGLFRTKRPRRSVYAHRFSFALANALNVHELGRDTVIRHRCDTPLCCNPLHLLAGTQAQNVDDKVERGRHLRGEDIRNHKLLAAEIPVIRGRLALGHKHADIAADFNVSRPTITLIANGKIWAWLKADNDNQPLSEAA